MSLSVNDMKKTTLALAVVVASVVGGAGSVRADSQLTWNGFNGTAIRYSFDANSNNPGNTFGSGETGLSSAGGTFQNAALTGGTYGVGALPFMYCLDIENQIGGSGSVFAKVYRGADVTNPIINHGSPAPPPIAPDYNRIAYLVDNYTVTSDLNVQAGFQAAMWKLVYGDDFKLQSTGAIKTAYDSFIASAALQGAYDLSTSKVLFINPYTGSNGNPSRYLQAMVSRVPVPSNLVMSAILFGMVGIGRFYKRVKSSSVAA